MRVWQIADIHGVPLLAQQPGLRAETFKGSASSESVWERVNTRGPMRLVHLRHKRPSPVAGHGGGLCIDSWNIH